MANYKLSSIISVTIKYALVRNGVYYYYRKIPLKLQSKLGKMFIRECVHTTDPLEAAKLIARKNREVERKWGNTRETPEEKAARLLADYGLKPMTTDGRTAIDPTDDDEALVDHFIDKLDAKRSAHARGDEDTYNNAKATDYWKQHEIDALRLVNEPPKFRLSDALKLFLSTHRKRDVLAFVEATERNWNGLIDVIGDKPFADIVREDARTFVADRLAKGLKTGSVRRQLTTIVAVINAVQLERDMHANNPFRKLQIANEKKDVTKRDTLTAEQMANLADHCRAKDDDMRWAIALQMDLGSRIAEVVGLALADLHPDAAVPYVEIKAHPWRSLKNDPTARKVPLVGMALWAAKRIKETAVPQQVYAFPRYINQKVQPHQCVATHASNGINKSIRGLGIDRTTHCLRHTMRDRLRAVEAPRDIQHAIGGWGAQDEGDKYGLGYTLDVLARWLVKVAA